MKYLIMFSFLLCSSAFSSGKLQFEPSYFLMSERMGYKGGIAIHEDLFGPFAYESWTGAGWTPQDKFTRMAWASSQHDVVFYVGDLSFSLGGGLNFGHEDLPEARRLLDYNVHARASFRLW